MQAVTGERERISADELRRLQRELVGTLAGDVFEIGAGTGANLAALSPAVRWTGSEPDARRRGQLHRASARPVLDARAEALPVGDASQDVILATFVFCSVDDVDRALGEAHRVLRADGRLVFVEHVAAPRGSMLRRVQSAITPLSRRLSHNCHYDRDPVSATPGRGFSVTRLERYAVASGIPGLWLPVDLFEGVVAGR